MSTSLIRFRHRVDGVLTDVDSIVLRDPTGAYGVKRLDTDAVVVAADTALTRVSLGLYEYSFTDPAAGVNYTYWVQWVYDGETLAIDKPLSAAPDIVEGTAYLTLSQARALANTLPGLVSFNAASDDAATAALLGASIDLDDSDRWQGKKYACNQVLAFPRIPERGVVWDWDEDEEEAVVPAGVKRACLWQADAILKGTLYSALEDQTQGIASKSAGSISISYRDPAAALATIGAGTSQGLCRQAAQAMKNYRLVSGSML